MTRDNDQVHNHDDHSHDHHGHSHAGHSHAPTSFGRAFIIGIALNTAFVAIEGAYGYWSNSVALLADAGHNLSDVLGLVVAWIAAVLVKRPATPRMTYGFRNASVLAALFNAVFLLVAVGAIGLEAIQRLIHPEPVAEKTVMIVAAIGILVNGATAMLFASGRKARLWDQFVALYGTIAAEAEDDFHTLFGKAFLEAYEEQMARLKDAGTPARR